MYKDLSTGSSTRNIRASLGSIEYGPQWNRFLASRIGSVRNSGLFDVSPKKFFEIGCSEGILLYELQNFGHEALGCECNGPTAKRGMEALGVSIIIGLFEEFSLPYASFDVVASFHTIEHIPDLGRTFARIVDILTPNGVVFIEVPTGPEEYTNTDHVQFFSDVSPKRLLERYFEVCETFPNRYSDADGVVIDSLYGVGRQPRRDVRQRQ